ncbi:helix-turn-helix transcriptional regulator [Chryseobacterium sp. ISL-6]|uniref:helix-turn-helix transcriptional regulator n=1 Tax=Chryseobacterium sp. ISL-6 TaxID=2819143 RepID=UPI001BE92D2B|nr:helix-turn-helix transcriptional regulator [Chryseobacterium sp. ISL-6]MBT2621274.1 helix-turn-helix transcriptional regulator [Chryseobacterium sp. ISL-6]
MQKKFFLYLLILCQNLYFSQSIKGFCIPDSLDNKSYEQLEKPFKKNLYINKAKAEVYANTILLKGKNNKNDEKIADGYLMLHRLSNDESALLYLDSMMMVSKKIQNSDYLADGNMYKGNYYYAKGEYSKALASNLAAINYAKKSSKTYYILNFNIGLLKLELKEYQQSIQLFLNYKQYLEKNNAERSLDYVSCIYALAYTYSQANDIDSSDKYVELGLKKSYEMNDGECQANLFLVSGINAYKRKKYGSALKILRKASKLIKDNSYNPQNLAISEYYIGKILYDNNDDSFLNTLQTVDSIIIETKNVTSELRDAYPILIDHYKKTGDKEKQLFYIEHLLSIDSILNKNNNFLTAEINKKYDTPLLLKEKEILISDLSSKNYTLFWILGIGGIIIICLFYLYDKNRRKVKVYQSKADLLTKSSIYPDVTEIANLPLKENLDFQKEKSKIILPDNKLKQLNLQLEEFEIENRFLDKKVNLDILSKEFNTNRAYLSKSVNELKGQNFSQYLNELRIRYIVNELKTDKNLQKLTIAAIADKAGYNNAESFTNAFKKMTDTLPSYFIKALQENSN